MNPEIMRQRMLARLDLKRRITEALTEIRNTEIYINGEEMYLTVDGLLLESFDYEDLLEYFKKDEGYESESNNDTDDESESNNDADVSDVDSDVE